LNNLSVHAGEGQGAMLERDKEKKSEGHAHTPQKLGFRCCFLFSTKICDKGHALSTHATPYVAHLAAQAAAIAMVN